MLKGVHQKLEPQQSPAFFVRGASPFTRMLFFCGLSIVMMAADSQFNYLSQVRQTFNVGLHPLERAANFPSELIRDAKKYFSVHTKNKKKVCIVGSGPAGFYTAQHLIKVLYFRIIN